uniref:AlNc14C46G3741 protein n=1 Tax=Albugo laibachii Nc14 TaxID=890382 RepID=F0WAL7_9STRA|nr:AlNc14C46G3741 [Albugo laibachii Nc14]|eukprot:CCA18188.1 AlNc14C46G3741 [Albugo laibachii Nc14]
MRLNTAATDGTLWKIVSEASKVSDGDSKIDRSCRQPKFDRYKHDRKLPSIVNSRIAKFENMTTQPRAAGITATRDEVRQQNRTVVPNQNHSNIPSELRNTKTKYSDLKPAENSPRKITTKAGFSTARKPSTARHGRLRNHVQDKISATLVLIPSRSEYGLAANTIITSSHIVASQVEKKNACPVDTEPKIISVAGHQWSNVRGANSNTSKENIKPHPIKTKTINLKLAAYLARVGSFTGSPEQAMSVIPRGKSERMSDREPSTTTTKTWDAEKLRAEKTNCAKSQLAEFCDKLAAEKSLKDLKQDLSQSPSEMKLTTEQTKALPSQSRTSEHLCFKLEDSSQIGWKDSDCDHTRTSVELCSIETTVVLGQDVLLSCESSASPQEDFSAQKLSQESCCGKMPSLHDNNAFQYEESAPCKPQSSENSSPENAESKFLAKHEFALSKASIASPVIGIDEIIACDKEELSLTHSSPLQSDTHELNQNISDCDGKRPNSTAETQHSLIDAPLQLTSAFDEPSLWETGKSFVQVPVLQSGMVQGTEKSECSIAAPATNNLVMPIVDMAEVNTLQEPTAERIFTSHKTVATVENVPASTSIQSSYIINENFHELSSAANAQIPGCGLVLSKFNPVVQAPTSSEIEVRNKDQSPIYSGKSPPSSKQSSCSRTVIDRGAEIMFDSLDGLDATFQCEIFEESSTLALESSKELTENEDTACERSSNLCIPSDGDTGHLQNKTSEINPTERYPVFETSLVSETTTIPESLTVFDSPIHSKRPTIIEVPTAPETSRASGTSSATEAPTTSKSLSAPNLSILSKTPTLSEPSSTLNTPRALDTSGASSAPTKVMAPTAPDFPIPTVITICSETPTTLNTLRAPATRTVSKSPTFLETPSTSSVSRTSDTPTVPDSPILSQTTSRSETLNTLRAPATTTISKSPTVPYLPILLNAPILIETPTVSDLPIPTRTPTLSETTTPTNTSRASDTPTSVLVREISAESDLAICSYRSEAQTGASSDQATDSFHSCSSHSTPTSSITDVYNDSILSEVEPVSLPTTPKSTSSSDDSSAWKFLSMFSTKYGLKNENCDASTPRISSPSILTALRHSSNSCGCSEAILESLPSSTKSIYSGPGTPGTARPRELNLDTEEDGMLMDCLESFHSCSSPMTSVAVLLTPVERGDLPLADTEKVYDLLMISCQTIRDLGDEKPNSMKRWTSSAEHIVIDNATSSPSASTDQCRSSKLTTRDGLGCTTPVEVPSSTSEDFEHSTLKERISSSTSLHTLDDRVFTTSNKSSISSERVSTSNGIAFESTVKVQRNNLWSRWYFSKENSDQNLFHESQKSIISAGKCHPESDESSRLSILAKTDNDAATDQDEEFYLESKLSQYRKSSSIKTPHLLPTTPATPQSLPTTPHSDHSGEENRSSRNTNSVGNSPDSSHVPTEGLKDSLHIGMQALKTIFQMNSTTKADRSSDTTTSSSLSDREEQSITAGCKVSTKYGLGTVVACNLRSEAFVIVKLQAGSMPLMMYCRTAQNMHVIPALRHEWVTTPSGEGCVINYRATERKYLIELAVDPTNGRTKSKNEQFFAETDIYRHARVKRIPSFLTSASSSQSWKNSSTISCSSRGSSAHLSPLGSNGDTDSSPESIKTSSTGLFANVLRRAMTTSNEISSSTMQYVSTRNSVGQFVVTPYGHGTITDVDHAKEVAVVKMAHTNETRGVDIHAIKYVLKALVGMNVQTSKFGSGTVVAIRPENAIYTVKLTKSWAHPNQDRVIYVHENDLKKAGRYSTGLQYSTFKLWG